MRVRDDPSVGTDCGEFHLQQGCLPTTERPAFHEAMAIAKTMQKPTRAKVKAWAAAMKKALG